MRTCIFQLYGPMVSWGDIAVGGERRSTVQPSRSAIIGIVAAALGIKRDAEEDLAKLTDAIRIAVRVDQPGSLLRDYHTAQVPGKDSKAVYLTRKDEMNAPSEKIKTVLSSREYRCDAYALVAICLNNDTWTLEQIVDALQHPTFHLYLGRKSAPPALPLSPQIVEADDLKQAFAEASFSRPLPVDGRAPDWMVRSFEQYSKRVFHSKTKHYYWEEEMVSGLDPLQKTVRYDQPISRSRWQFQMRDEYMAIEQEQREEAGDAHQ